jgi:nitrite reductase/ring-hydroxylating ferredoxin subunit
VELLIPLTDLSEDELTHCEHGGESILVGLADGKPFAIRNLCTHAYVTFGHGTLHGCKITCPWHGLSFDVFTGECMQWPDLERITRYDVEVHEGRVRIGRPIVLDEKTLNHDIDSSGGDS